ncbi:hypothetical protein LZ554_005823 [Drepanopeziza brunnea f. sp. 'monogermtubi']|nr:hypothetical protein LZ554_005823 [Drepanopeziza brunnea f. sp. 'monogermtubi']
MHIRMQRTERTYELNPAPDRRRGPADTIMLPLIQPPQQAKRLLARRHRHRHRHHLPSIDPSASPQTRLDLPVHRYPQEAHLAGHERGARQDRHGEQEACEDEQDLRQEPGDAEGDVREVDEARGDGRRAQDDQDKAEAAPLPRPCARARAASFAWVPLMLPMIALSVLETSTSPRNDDVKH